MPANLPPYFFELQTRLKEATDNKENLYFRGNVSCLSKT